MTWFLYSFISALCSAASALTQKKALQKLEAFDFCLLISVFNVLFSLPFFVKAPWESLTFPIALLIIGKSFLNALGFWSVMKGIKTLELSRGLPLLALTPLFVALGGFIFLGETLNLMDLGGLALVVLGALLLEFREGQLEWKHFSKHGAILLALFFMTLNTLLDRYVMGPLKVAPPLVMALTQSSFLLFFLLIWSWVRTPIKQLAQGFKSTWSWLLIIAVLTLSYRYTNLLALALAPAALVIAVKRSSVFFAAALGGKIFHEGHIWKRSFAAILLVAGTMLLFKHGG